jgi:hypothetical protein
VLTKGKTPAARFKEQKKFDAVAGAEASTVVDGAEEELDEDALDNKQLEELEG